jgi:hypothetical protein
MAFFRTVNLSEQVATIEGTGVVLRPPLISDFDDWAAIRERSREFLTPWEPTWPLDDLTRSAFRRRLKRYAEDQRTDQSYAFFIFTADRRALIGGLTLANVLCPPRFHGSVRPRYHALFVFGAAAAPVGSRLHPDQPRLDQAPRILRICPRRLCAPISMHQRDMAGPFALCSAQG